MAPWSVVGHHIRSAALAKAHVCIGHFPLRHIPPDISPPGQFPSPLLRTSPRLLKPKFENRYWPVRLTITDLPLSMLYTLRQTASYCRLPDGGGRRVEYPPTNCKKRGRNVRISTRERFCAAQCLTRERAQALGRLTLRQCGLFLLTYLLARLRVKRCQFSLLVVTRLAIAWLPWTGSSRTHLSLSLTKR